MFYSINSTNRKIYLQPPWLRKKKAHRQTIVHKTQHRKPKAEQHDLDQKLVVNVLLKEISHRIYINAGACS